MCPLNPVVSRPPTLWGTTCGWHGVRDQWTSSWLGPCQCQILNYRVSNWTKQISCFQVPGDLHHDELDYQAALDEEYLERHSASWLMKGDRNLWCLYIYIYNQLIVYTLIAQRTPGICSYVCRTVLNSTVSIYHAFIVSRSTSCCHHDQVEMDQPAEGIVTASQVLTDMEQCDGDQAWGSMSSLSYIITSHIRCHFPWHYFQNCIGFTGSRRQWPTQYA